MTKEIEDDALSLNSSMLLFEQQGLIENEEDIYRFGGTLVTEE